MYNSAVAMRQQLGRRLPTRHRLFIKPFVLGLSAGTAIHCTMQSGPAAAAAHPQVAPRLQAVLKHLDQNPMQLSSVPMIYAADVQVDVPPVAQGLGPADVLGSKLAEQAPDHATVILALIDVAFKALDSAHNRVTPLSWGSPTEYGGPPKRGSPAAKDAAYVHALVHRWEGENDGEFGTGFSNANYWYRAAGDHPVSSKLQDAAQQLAAGDEKLARYVAGNKLDPTRLVNLCSDAVKNKDTTLVDFANKVINLEWRLMLDWCVESAKQQAVHK